jgi:hypothetical protein
MAGPSSLGAIIGPLFGSSGGGKKKSKAKAKAAPPMDMPTPMTPYKEPSPTERVKSHARNAKVNATQDWVEGRMSTESHKNVHKRANHVLTNKKPEQYKGKNGEKAKMGRGIY